MTPLLTTATFLLFIAYVEQYALRMRLKAMRCHVYQTWGRADWVYPCVREQRGWMRRGVVQQYRQNANIETHDKMKTDNTHTPYNDQTDGSGSPSTTCYADYMLPESAPRDRKIMGFFEDIGWHPACWSEASQMWNIAYCAGVPETTPEEPQWIERAVYAADLCWWREWPSNRWQDNPYHNGYGADYDSDSQHNESSDGAAGCGPNSP